jgi:hypothetical protein
MENQPTDYYVYTLLDPRDVERIIYIGMGRGVRRYSYTRRTKRLRAFFAEYGKAPCRIVSASLTKDAAFALEVELIAKYGRECDGGQLLNVSLGGAGAPGRVADAETREKMAFSHQGERFSEERKAKLRTPKSAETRIKMSAARTGRKLSGAVLANARASAAKATAAAALVNRGRRWKHTPEQLEKMRCARRAYLARSAVDQSANRESPDAS